MPQEPDQPRTPNSFKHPAAGRTGRHAPSRAVERGRRGPSWAARSRPATIRPWLFSHAIQGRLGGNAMALVPCGECGHKISHTARTCAGCGAERGPQREIIRLHSTVSLILWMLGRHCRCRRDTSSDVPLVGLRNATNLSHNRGAATDSLAPAFSRSGAILSPLRASRPSVVCGSN